MEIEYREFDLLGVVYLLFCGGGDSIQAKYVHFQIVLSLLGALCSPE